MLQRETVLAAAFEEACAPVVRRATPEATESPRRDELVEGRERSLIGRSRRSPLRELESIGTSRVPARRPATRCRRRTRVRRGKRRASGSDGDRRGDRSVGLVFERPRPRPHGRTRHRRTRRDRGRTSYVPVDQAPRASTVSTPRLRVGDRRRDPRPRPRTRATPRRPLTRRLRPRDARPWIPFARAAHRGWRAGPRAGPGAARARGTRPLRGWRVRRSESPTLRPPAVDADRQASRRAPGGPHPRPRTRATARRTPLRRRRPRPSMPPRTSPPEEPATPDRARRWCAARRRLLGQQPARRARGGLPRWARRATLQAGAENVSRRAHRRDATDRARPAVDRSVGGSRRDRLASAPRTAGSIRPIARSRQEPRGPPRARRTIASVDRRERSPARGRRRRRDRHRRPRRPPGQ